MVDDPLDIFDPGHIYPTEDSAPERDKYVRRLEDQLVDLKSFVSFNKLEPDLEKYRNKVKEINEKKK